MVRQVHEGALCGGQELGCRTTRHSSGRLCVVSNFFYAFTHDNTGGLDFRLNEYVQSITYANDNSGNEATKLKVRRAAVAMKDAPILSEQGACYRAMIRELRLAGAARAFLD
eukprot:1214487-Pleurochrysis_carterae.AAC.1